MSCAGTENSYKAAHYSGRVALSVISKQNQFERIARFTGSDVSFFSTSEDDFLGTLLRMSDFQEIPEIRAIEESLQLLSAQLPSSEGKAWL